MFDDTFDCFTASVGVTIVVVETETAFVLDAVDVSAIVDDVDDVVVVVVGVGAIKVWMVIDVPVNSKNPFSDAKSWNS